MTPETRPNKEILERFLAWVKVLKKPIDECLKESFTRYYEDSDLDLFNLSHIWGNKYKTLSFEIDLETWERFKRYAWDRWKHSRDEALSIAIKLFVDYYDNKLKEVL